MKRAYRSAESFTARSVTQTSHARSSPAAINPATNETAGSSLVAVHAVYVDQAEPATPATVRNTPEDLQTEEVSAEAVIGEPLEDEGELFGVPRPPNKVLRA